jgi:hypothetical protein
MKIQSFRISDLHDSDVRFTHRLVQPNGKRLHNVYCAHGEGHFSR